MKAQIKQTILAHINIVPLSIENLYMQQVLYLEQFLTQITRTIPL